MARDIVYRGNIYKFMQNKGLLEKLLATSGTTLVECSPYDKIWGIGLAEDDPRCYNRATWKGKNWLGETLTKVRDDLEVVEWSIIMKDLANLNPVKAVYFGELKYDKRTYFARF